MCSDCKCAELTKELADLKYNYEQLLIGLERSWRIAKGNYDLCYPKPKPGEPLVA